MQLIKEIGTLIDVSADDVHLAATHRLPDTKNVKHPLIVKFVHSPYQTICILKLILKLKCIFSI